MRMQWLKFISTIKVNFGPFFCDEGTRYKTRENNETILIEFNFKAPKMLTPHSPFSDFNHHACKCLNFS